MTGESNSEHVAAGRQQLARPPQRDARDLFGAAVAADAGDALPPGEAYRSMRLDVVQGWHVGRALDDDANRRHRPASASAARRPARDTLGVADVDGAQPRVLHPAQPRQHERQPRDTLAVADINSRPSRPQSARPAPPAPDQLAADPPVEDARYRWTAMHRPRRPLSASAVGRRPESNPVAPVYAVPGAARLTNAAAAAVAAAARDGRAVLLTATQNSAAADALLHNDFGAPPGAAAGLSRPLSASEGGAPAPVATRPCTALRGAGAFKAAHAGPALAANDGGWGATAVSAAEGAAARAAFDKLGEALPDQRRSANPRLAAPPSRAYIDYSDCSARAPTAAELHAALTAGARAAGTGAAPESGAAVAAQPPRANVPPRHSDPLSPRYQPLDGAANGGGAAAYGAFDKRRHVGLATQRRTSRITDCSDVDGAAPGPAVRGAPSVSSYVARRLREQQQLAEQQRAACPNVRVLSGTADAEAAAVQLPVRPPPPSAAVPLFDRVCSKSPTKPVRSAESAAALASSRRWATAVARYNQAAEAAERLAFAAPSGSAASSARAGGVGYAAAERERQRAYDVQAVRDLW